MIVDRIMEIIDYKGINKNRFYKETGLSNGFLDKVKDIGASKIEHILISYPEISAEWLITGKGEMLRQADNCTTKIEEFNKILEENYELKQVEKYLEEKIAALKEEISSVQKELIQSKNEIIALERKVQSLLNKK